MATTFPAIMAIVNADTSTTSDILGIGRRGFAADLLPPPTRIDGSTGGTPIPLTAAARASAVATIVAGTITTLSDVVTLLNTAVTGATTLTHVQRIVAGYNDITVG